MPDTPDQNKASCPLCGGGYIYFDSSKINVPGEKLIWGGFF
jgi:hypothetical protein